jgi:hypothetical protein
MVDRDWKTECNKRNVMCDNRENTLLRRSSFQCNFTELINISFHGREGGGGGAAVQEQPKLYKKAKSRIV